MLRGVLQTLGSVVLLYIYIFLAFHIKCHVLTCELATDDWVKPW